MVTVSLSSPSISFSVYEKPFFPLQAPHLLSHGSKPIYLAHSSNFPRFHSLRVSINKNGMMVKKNQRGSGTVCRALQAHLTGISPWLSTISYVLLILVKDPAPEKVLLVPLFALRAPTCMVSSFMDQFLLGLCRNEHMFSHFRSKYGILIAFMGLCLRYFFSVPDKLELLFAALLLVIVVPGQFMNFREISFGLDLTIVLLLSFHLQEFLGMVFKKKN